MTGLRATARLQFHHDFTLDDAVGLVGYFEALGISHVYASPLLKARSGSTHGYDGVDPTRINPELGGESGLRRLVEALRARGMGLILDIVPNHLAVGGRENPWWQDVLKWGQESLHAHYFDIDWNSPDPTLNGKLLAPFLGTPYDEALRSGDVKLCCDYDRGEFFVEYFEHRFPIDPRHYGDILRHSDESSLKGTAEVFEALTHYSGPSNIHSAANQAHVWLRDAVASPQLRDVMSRALLAFDATTDAGFEQLHGLLERQHYRLAWWRTASDDINWRRFFDITELGAVRVEVPDVFEASHALIFRLVEEGLVDGLRIDHIDGLSDPKGYCLRLRQRLDDISTRRPEGLAGQHIPIFAEKILAEGETMHVDWNIDGTTGYEFMNDVSALQHDGDGEAALRELWTSLSGRPGDFLVEVKRARRLMLKTALASEFESAARSLLAVARSMPATRDVTLGMIRRALRELVAQFGVYRTYADEQGRPEVDEAVFRQALEAAKPNLDPVERNALDYLERWLGGEAPQKFAAHERELRLKAITKFQQLTSPVAAKAVEDTAGYRSAVLISRNDVGFDPQHFSASSAEFHTANQNRLENFPRNLLTTATHDHKRGEDVRARLAVLSEHAEWFADRVRCWMTTATSFRAALEDGVAPTPGDEMMLYQIMVGAWPLGLAVDDHDGMHEFAERLAAWQKKALREAKLESHWWHPNEGYERACRDMIFTLLESPEAQDLRNDIAAAVQAVAPAGAVNGLAQTLLKMTSPGVPDLYQGCEYWDFSLVDPDNRRPVDFDARRAALADTATPAELLESWHDGRIKQAVIARTLALRKQLPELFAKGDYAPLMVEGAYAERVVAFARELEGRTVVVVAPRLPAALMTSATLPRISSDQWADTRIHLPASAGWTNMLDGVSFKGTPDSMAVGDILVSLPIALLASDNIDASNEARV
ncbi:malto-oligosyltrehalose synthase [Phytohalomonas tamaricis]|uniref:malto-oligosyltrehalose synthase n=1 Tax=Phytohalomonas tamaricis TaxID=2081032 RepID=UPI000D0B6165|nr:malto-oligosyltrehalose synthase [Phytohalomonas tamaricis]